MLQSEFEIHTGIFPDALLYEAAEHEYNNGDWSSKADFCNAVKFDEDGLAHKIQRVANERWIKANEEISRLRSSVKPLTDKCERLTAENGALKEENESLFTELSELMKRVEVLNKQVEELPKGPQGFTPDQIKIAIQEAYQSAAHDDCKGDEILHMVWGFDYLLEGLGIE